MSKNKPDSEDREFIELDTLINALIYTASQAASSLSTKRQKIEADLLTLKLYKVQWSIIVAMMGPLIPFIRQTKDGATRETLSNELINIVTKIKISPMHTNDPEAKRRFNLLKQAQIKLCQKYADLLFDLSEASELCSLPNTTESN